MDSKIKKIMSFGTFDGIHPGHISFLKQCYNFGDRLMIIVARDKNVKKIKGKMPKKKEDERREDLIKSGLADEVILGKFDNKYKLVEYYKPDVICLGYDQEYFIKDLPEKLKKFGLEETEIVRLQSFHPEKYKSSKINGN
jgi:FAD synthetase